MDALKDLRLRCDSKYKRGPPDLACGLSESPSDIIRRPPKPSIQNAIETNAIRNPDLLAIVSRDYPSLSYRELQTTIASVGDLLRQAKFGCSTKIAVSIPAHREAVLALITITCNAIAVPIDPKLAPPELEQRLRILRPQAIVVPFGEDHPARELALRLGISIIEIIADSKGRFELALTHYQRPIETAPLPEFQDDVAFVLQTSGTTALPKFVPVSHRNMLASAARLQTWLGLSQHDRCLSVASPYYSHGLTATVFTPLLTGGSVALPTSTTTADFSEWFCELKPTWYSATPTLHRYVLDVARTIPDTGIAHTLRFMLSGGMAFPPLIRDQIQEVFGVPVLEHYGLSEAAQVACNQPPPGSNKLGTCGKPWAGSVIIVGADGEMLAAGEQGEILVTGDTVISGYLNDPEMSHPAFVDGWFHTGDIGSLDAEGFLTLHARKKELINRGGQKIAPIEIESVLLRHPAVAEAAAFAVPHPRLGEDVGAAVVLEPGAAIVDNDLKAFLAGCLASFKVPHRILIVNRLPKTANGKLLRRQMAQSRAANAGTEPGATITSAESAVLERKILALWRKLLQSDQIGVDDDFFDSGGDSLQALEMLAELERTIEQPIPTGLLFGASTVRQIVDRLHRQAERFDANVIYLHSGGNRPPLLLFHGDYENNSPFFLVGLARCLGPDQPIIGIAPHGVAGDPIPDSIAAMAASRLELILRLQPEGPYRIGGFCNGAMVACETARLLSGIGRRVELLILIDPPSIGVHRVFQSILSTMRFFSAGTATWVWRWMVRSEKASRMSVPEMGEYFWSGLRPRLNRALSPRMYAPYFRRALLPTTREKQFSAVMAQYHPKPLDVQAVYYAGAYDGIRWRWLFPKLEVVQIPGGHYGSLTTHMDCLAKHLRAKLDALSPEASDPDIRIVAIARSVRTDEPADLHPRSV